MKYEAFILYRDHILFQMVEVEAMHRKGAFAKLQDAAKKRGIEIKSAMIYPTNQGSSHDADDPTSGNFRRPVSDAAAASVAKNWNWLMIAVWGGGAFLSFNLFWAFYLIALRVIYGH